MECWEQSTHLSWLTTNTTQSHTKKQHLFLTNKNKREHTKSFNFHQHSLASPAQQSLQMSIEAKLHLAHNSCTSWSPAAHKVAHTPWCASWSQVARYSVSFPFQAVALGDSSTDLALTTHNTQELTYKHRRWKKHTHISVNTPYKSFTFPYYNTEVFIDTQCSFHSWCVY